MPRGPKKHLKRLAAPKHWMLDKMGGIFAPRPAAGPHKMRECIPLVLLIRNRLKYALNYKEVNMILLQRFVKVDGKVRTDMKFPCGFMDVITIEETQDAFRLLYNTKGRFSLLRISEAETKYKLCKVTRAQMGPGGIPYIVTHDGRTIRYAHPDIKVNDTVRLNIENGKIDKHVKFHVGNVCMITSGKNVGRVGIVKNLEKHLGADTIAYVEDLAGRPFATLAKNLFVIGEGNKPMVTLPKGGGVKLSVIEQKRGREKKQEQYPKGMLLSSIQRVCRRA